MKTEVYSWRVSAARKADLESEARREGTSLAELLQQITDEWLIKRRNGDEADQSALRSRVMATVGTFRGGDPTRSRRASELVRESVRQKHEKESNASRRTD